MMRGVTLYTPDDVSYGTTTVALKLHLPPSTASVVWHGASFEQHPRALLCRVHMYPVTDGFLDAAHETPPILRFCFVELDGAWHAFDAFAETVDFEMSAENSAEFRRRAAHVVATAGAVRWMSAHKSANALHARFYFNNIERGSEPPAEAMPYERMIHAAVQPVTVSDPVEEPTEESIDSVVSPTTLGLMSRIAAFTKSTLAILVALSLLLLRCVAQLRSGKDKQSWLRVMYSIGQCALRVIATLVGTYITGVAMDVMSSWVRRAIAYAFPVYELMTRTSTNALDAVRCIIKLQMPFVVAWVAPTTWFLGSLTPILGDIPTLLLRITDEVIGVSAMSEANRTLCERIDLGQRILSSVGNLVAFFQNMLFDMLLKVGFESISSRSGPFKKILGLSHLSSKTELTSADVADLHDAVATLLSALGVTLPKLGPWAEVARTLFTLAIFALVLAIKATVGGTKSRIKATVGGTKFGNQGTGDETKAERWFGYNDALRNVVSHCYSWGSLNTACAEKAKQEWHSGLEADAARGRQLIEENAAQEKLRAAVRAEATRKEDAKRKAEAEAARRKAEDATKQKAKEDAAKQKAQEAEAAKQKAKEVEAERKKEVARKLREKDKNELADDLREGAADEAEEKRIWDEIRRNKAAEEQAKLEAERSAKEDAAKQKADAEEAAKQKAQDAEAAKQKAKEAEAERKKEVARKLREKDKNELADDLREEAADEAEEKRIWDEIRRNKAAEEQAKLEAERSAKEALQKAEKEADLQAEQEHTRLMQLDKIERERRKSEFRTQQWWDATWNTTSAFVESFLYAYATLIVAHYAPHSRAALLACAPCEVRVEAAMPTVGAATGRQYIAPVTLGPRRADAIDGEASRGLVVLPASEKVQLHVVQTPFKVGDRTEVGAVAYVSAGPGMKSALGAIKDKLALPLDFVIARETPRESKHLPIKSISIAFSELASNQAPVLVPADSSITMLLDVGNIMIGSKVYKVWCKNFEHPWQEQMAGGTRQLAKTEAEAIELLLRAAHLGKRQAR